MSYHELKFLQAEALCRLNRTSDAEKALKEAVAAGIANAERSVSSAITYMGSKMVVNSEKMTEETANTYFDNQVKPFVCCKSFERDHDPEISGFVGGIGRGYRDF